MIYVALLRGINVGGKNKVVMSELKAGFEDLGFTHVKTYINSGNILFYDDRYRERELVTMIQKKIKELFDLDIAVLVRSKKQYDALMEYVLDEWVEDEEIRVNTIFLFDEIDEAAILDKIKIRDGIDEVLYYPGVIFWKNQRSEITKSASTKLIGTKPYQYMTIRNLNTTVKLHKLMNEIEAKL